MCVTKIYIMSIQLKKPGHTRVGKGVDYVNGSNRYQRHLSAEQLSKDRSTARLVKFGVQ